ncbi:hypothetical protein DL766_008162 [Monosporascus sp. MC13-8B]|uniref:F-box domain-containing protein n=1 Tax=Monosporascus cannonballus TaxID=155416 RepID=A0ABY0GVI5_9PEZI|nr:hypothetical protein DL762_008661 [Monosporascus cannonballus]RYP20588.1 hypothetical protein DL766_008162 [Monosporascus sp. MC13-8B]
MDPSPDYCKDLSLLRRRRLLLDIKELTEKPYPNILLHVHDDDLTSACLVLTPANYKPLHLTVRFQDYPGRPPKVEMDSRVSHPNVFNRYICADVLKEGLGYTPAYTLKGIAIQMLSFFGSESVEQEYGGNLSLAQYRNNDSACDEFACDKCGFKALPVPRSDQCDLNLYDALGGDENLDLKGLPSHDSAGANGNSIPSTFAIQKLPNELLLVILDKLEDFEDITRFAKVWPRVSRLIGDYDIIRRRELQCFVTKQTYRVAKLGVGVSVRKGRIASEFDLVSKEAFFTFKVRRSVHNIGFNHWLPLPISRSHWTKTRSDMKRSVVSIKQELRSPSSPYAQPIYHFMNDIVVRLNMVADNVGYEPSKSTLRHASEKAIESYFHLFHLLVCMATEDLTMVQDANRLLRNFAEGRRSKADCPSLGHLLIALLISDVEVTDDLVKAIVTEAITRNVVWLLDGRGANMAELSYLEPAPVSAYRLDRTFEGSRTSYRLLMFSELFRRTARPSHKKPLSEVREELFCRHGAPPRGAAGHLAASVRRLHTINDFPAFLREMGLRKVPSAEDFTEVLRQTVVSSMEKGYSTWALTQREALLLRTYYEPEVPMTPEMREWARQHSYDDVMARPISFFPNHGDGRDRAFFPSRRGRGGISRGRGDLGRGGRGGTTRGEMGLP